MSQIARAEAQERGVSDSLTAQPLRYAAHGDSPAILADVYREEVNIAIWRRFLTPALQESVEQYLASNRHNQCAMTVTPQTVRARVGDQLANAKLDALADDIAYLVEMFCCLFGLQRAGVRLISLERAMCPKFHVDKLPCRLVTTFHGPATQWLPQNNIQRTSTNNANASPDSGPLQLTYDEHNIAQLSCGEVALLKGERWEGNENGGIVHRSPALSGSERRLLLTLDFCA